MRALGVTPADALGELATISVSGCGTRTRQGMSVGRAMRYSNVDVDQNVALHGEGQQRLAVWKMEPQLVKSPSALRNASPYRGTPKSTTADQHVKEIRASTSLGPATTVERRTTRPQSYYAPPVILGYSLIRSVSGAGAFI